MSLSAYLSGTTYRIIQAKQYQVKGTNIILPPNGKNYLLIMLVIAKLM